ncbi:MAG: polysaccharide deacetylase family protein [Sphingobacteriales bacterium]|nr:MAG: polysaccharide deacetylase family protein [Sphingobacteriales bacterium]
MIILISVCFGFIIFLIIEYSFLLPQVKGLPVLMYHKVTEDNKREDYLTISVSRLKQQIDYLAKKGYTPILLSDLLNYHFKQVDLPVKPVLITFDDGYKDNYTHLYPLLQQYNMKASVFLVAKFLEEGSVAEKESEYLSFDDLKKMALPYVEFGLHSYDHKNYATLSPAEADADIKKMKEVFDKEGVNYQPCFAYPYGAYPKKDTEKQLLLMKTLQSNNIQLAFRIGNRYNKLPLETTFFIKRIDIKGTDSMFRFKAKMRTGRSKLFS